MYLKATCLPFVVLLPGMNGALLSFVNMVMSQKGTSRLFHPYPLVYFVSLQTLFVGWVFFKESPLCESVAPNMPWHLSLSVFLHANVLLKYPLFECGRQVRIVVGRECILSATSIGPLIYSPGAWKFIVPFWLSLIGVLLKIISAAGVVLKTGFAWDCRGTGNNDKNTSCF